MAILVREHPMTRSQRKGAEEPEKDPQQKDQSDATEGKDIADYEGSEHKAEPVTLDEREVDPDADYMNMEIT